MRIIEYLLHSLKRTCNFEGAFAEANFAFCSINFERKAIGNMRKQKMAICGLGFLALALLMGCATTTTSLLNVKATSDKATAEKTYNAVTALIVDQGFDVKTANKDIGLVTTEYKKFAALAGSPPFDFYLQIKTQIKTTANGKLQVVMTPIVKESNRLNAAAFTEYSLVFLSDKDKEGYMDARKKAMLAGQVLFLNVVQGVAETLGLSMEELEYDKQSKTITTLPI
jgi:hypothetical protein